MAVVLGSAHCHFKRRINDISLMFPSFKIIMNDKVTLNGYMIMHGLTLWMLVT